ncbi:MAG: AhpC/TSA family protein [Prevotella sp.]|jgi:peroxiredoxin|nr:AhpC/TSA family protein [Prevotella sp.]
MRFKTTITILLSLLSLSGVKAQNIPGTINEFNLEVTIAGQKGKKMYLGQYFREATYARDSVIVSNSGKAIFTAKEKYPEAQYFIYIEPDIRADLLIGDDQKDIQITLNSANPQKSTVSGSSDTKLLWNYLNWAADNDKKKASLEKQLYDPKTTDKKKADLEKEITAEEETSLKYVENLITDNKDNWFGTFLKGMTPVALPHPSPENEQDFAENIQYGRVHYFDNIDLTDQRLWSTNYLTSIIDSYMQQWVDQTPDSLAMEASKLVAKTNSNEFCYKEMLTYLINSAISSDRMGDENIWARLFEEYIFNAKHRPDWIDSAQMIDLQKMYEKVKDNRIGMKAHNLILTTLIGDTIKTNDIEADYLILYFYSHDCNHCIMETPVLHDKLYKKYKDKGVQVVAIDLKGEDKEEWEKFVETNKIANWINVADPMYKSQYWIYYDISKIPSVFVLDKNKKIVAKKLESKGLGEFFDYYIK